MEIKGKDVLVLGGTGLVGAAVCREILKENPRKLFISALRKDEIHEIYDEMSELVKKIGVKTQIESDWGNIFVREELKGKTTSEIREEASYRKMIIEDVIEELTEERYKRSFLRILFENARPNIVMDCVNTATAFAYQDLYSASLKARHALLERRVDVSEEMEMLLLTLYIPQLVRHIQILDRALREFKVGAYLKVGTSGTGGMGLNIPYTHSEEKPSRVLLSKSAMAGAHSILLFLMGRTPGSPIIKEIKPTAAIGWKNISYGKILRRGKPITLYDCQVESACILSDVLKIQDERYGKSQNRELQAVYIDTGENGQFSASEFTALTALEQMEFVTPEEIAKYSVREVRGEATGYDIINALESASLEPTYRAGALRQFALDSLKKMEEKYGEGIAFEILGPPRLSKLLFECYLLREVYPRWGKSQLDVLSALNTQEAKRKIMELIRGKRGKDIREKIISIGIPILLPDGKRLLRARRLTVPVKGERNEIRIGKGDIDRWAYAGWVDLREENLNRWKERFAKIRVEMLNAEKSTDSSHDIRKFVNERGRIEIGEIVAWVFINEEGGKRSKR